MLWMRCPDKASSSLSLESPEICSPGSSCRNRRMFVSMTYATECGTAGLIAAAIAVASSLSCAPITSAWTSISRKSFLVKNMQRIATKQCALLVGSPRWCHLAVRLVDSRKFLSCTPTISNILKVIAMGGVSLFVAGGARAATIELLPGEWSRFVFPKVGDQALDTLAFKSSPTGARLLITDAGASGDRFSISINGSLVGTTSLSSAGSTCGFNAETCFLSPFMSKGEFNLDTGGTQNIEITSIANAFRGIGGVGFVRPETSFVNLHGNDGVVSRFTSLLNSSAKGIQFYAQKLDPATSFTQLFAKVIDKSAINSLGAILNDIVSGLGPNAPKAPIDLALVDDATNVYGGAACVNSSATSQSLGVCSGSYRFQALDVADLEKLPLSPKHDLPASVIAHELTEAVGLGYGLSFETSHGAAIAYQNDVLRDEFGSQRALTIGGRSLPAGIIINNLFFDGRFTKPLLSAGAIQDYSTADTLWYSDGSGENRILFPWVDPSGAEGWSIWVFKSTASAWTFADLMSGFIETGVPWSGRIIDISLESIGFEPTLTPATSVPAPLPIWGIATAFGYSRMLRKRIARSKSLPVASPVD